MFKVIDKKIIIILHKLFWLNWPYVHNIIFEKPTYMNASLFNLMHYIYTSHTCTTISRSCRDISWVESVISMEIKVPCLCDVKALLEEQGGSEQVRRTHALVY